MVVDRTVVLPSFEACGTVEVLQLPTVFCGRGTDAVQRAMAEWLDVDCDMGDALVARTWSVEGAAAVASFCTAVNARLAVGASVSDAIGDALVDCAEKEQVPVVGEPWERIAGW